LQAIVLPSFHLSNLNKIDVPAYTVQVVPISKIFLYDKSDLKNGDTNTVEENLEYFDNKIFFHHPIIDGSRNLKSHLTNNILFKSSRLIIPKPP
jgi:hypothetical protein